jgi:hypothetical protein
VATHPRLIKVPKILETPYVNDLPPYKKEIEMLRTGNLKIGYKKKDFGLFLLSKKPGSSPVILRMSFPISFVSVYRPVHFEVLFL